MYTSTWTMEPSRPWCTWSERQHWQVCSSSWLHPTGRWLQCLSYWHSLTMTLGHYNTNHPSTCTSQLIRRVVDYNVCLTDTAGRWLWVTTTSTILVHALVNSSQYLMFVSNFHLILFYNQAKRQHIPQLVNLRHINAMAVQPSAGCGLQLIFIVLLTVY